MILKNYTLKIGLYQPTVNYTICCSLIILNTNKDGEQEMLDTWWIYFSDGSFAQFAILEDSVVLFNEGMYQLNEDGSFLYETTPVTDVITFDQIKKYLSDGQTDDESSQDFDLGAYGDVRIVAIGE